MNSRLKNRFFAILSRQFSRHYSSHVIAPFSALVLTISVSICPAFAATKLPQIDSIRINLGDTTSLTVKKNFTLTGEKAAQGLAFLPKVKKNNTKIKLLRYSINGKRVDSKKSPYSPYFNRKGVTLYQTLAAGTYKFQITPQYVDSARRTKNGKKFTITMTINPIVVISSIPTPTPTNEPRFTNPFPTAIPAPQIDTAKVPAYDKWVARMLEFGNKNCNVQEILAGGVYQDKPYNFDGLRAYNNILQFTGDPYWNQCIDAIRSVYRGYILTPNIYNDNYDPSVPGQPGAIPAYRLFPVGLRADFLTTKDPLTLKAIIALSTSDSPFVATRGSSDTQFAFENAGVLNTFVVRELTDGVQIPGAARTAAANAVSQLNQWRNQSLVDFQPLQVALTVDALVRYYQFSHDESVIGPAYETLKWLAMYWDGKQFPLVVHCSNPSSESSPCYGVDPTQGIDLNLLFAYSYLWTGQHFSDTSMMSFADDVFRAGVEGQLPNGQVGAYLDRGKQFAQNYSMSFDYVVARSQMP